MLNSEFIRITDWVGHVSVFIVSGAHDLFLSLFDGNCEMFLIFSI